MRCNQKKWKMKEEVRMKEQTNKQTTFIRKAIGLLVCFAMVAIMLPANVAKATATSTSVPVIDDSQKGSITIHKYEYNKPIPTPNVPTPTDIAGNGKENQAVPDGAVALEGAGFTIYKVADLDDYYGIDGAALPDATTYYETVDGKYQVKSAYGTNSTGPVTTSSTGIAKFDNLDLGLYLVVETTTPDKVTTPIAPFLVSVPMTTAEGEEWLYDVHVYPKNATTYAGVKLKKTGKTGTGSETPLAGATFVLQKKQADGTYKTVTQTDKGVNLNYVDDDHPGDISGTLTTATDGTITIADLSQGEYRFIETGIGNNYGYILDGVTAYTFTISSSGAITYGSNTPTITAGTDTYISVVNKKPDVTKQVLNREAIPTPVNEADYSVGDTVSYKITVNVPENVGDLRKFQVKDTPDNAKLQYTTGTLKVYKADGTTEIPVTDATTQTNNYTITSDSTTGGFTVEFNTTNTTGIKGSAGADIIITYDAVLQSGAVTTKDGNPNTVDLIYEDKILPDSQADGNPNPTANPTPTEFYEIEDSATVYTFKITINKTGDDGTTPLAGVKFDLYKEVESGTTGALTTDQASDLGLPSTSTWKKVETLTTKADGSISPTEGLGNGIYYLVETETNDGYNLLSEPVKVELKATYTTSFSISSTGESKQVKNGIDNTKNVLTEKMSVNDGADQSNFTVSIKNSKGFTLPTTGGAGGFLFTLIGCCIMIVGIIIFYKSRNKQATN